VFVNSLLFLHCLQAEKCSKFQMQTHLISPCLKDQAMVTLFGLIEMENPISKVASTLRVITKKKGEAASLAKQGLHELETIITNTEALGVKVIGYSLLYSYV
jgi:translation initiation factor 2-alpha kinase 4